MGGKYKDGYDSFGLCVTFFELHLHTKDDFVCFFESTFVNLCGHGFSALTSCS